MRELLSYFAFPFLGRSFLERLTLLLVALSLSDDSIFSKRYELLTYISDFNFYLGDFVKNI